MTDEQVEKIIKANMSLQMNIPGIRADFEEAMRRKPLTEWIDPNDKTQKQYLPHIGEPVLFCHGGKTYCGHHNGGSFQNQDGYFNTWECRWMYLPAAHGIKGDA